MKRTRYVISYIDNYKKEINNRANDARWERFETDEIKRLSRYLSDNIKILYGLKSGVCDFYRIRKKNYIDYGIFSNNLNFSFNREGEEVFNTNIGIEDIYEVKYKTGITLLVLEVRYNIDEKLQNIANIGFAITHCKLNQEKKKGEYIDIWYTDEQYDEKGCLVEKTFYNTIRKIINYDKLVDKSQYAVSDKILAYHNLVVANQECNKDNCMLFFLRRGREYVEKKNRCKYNLEKSGCDLQNSLECPCNIYEESEFVYSNTEQAVWSGCSNGVVSLAKKTNFVMKNYKESVFNGYYLLFLYLVHERILLQEYSIETVKYFAKEKKMLLLKDRIMKFNGLFGFNVVSDEMSYQKFYNNLHTAFKLNVLEKEIQEISVKLADYTEKKSNKKLDNAYGMVLLLSVVSVINTLTSFIVNIADENKNKALLLATIITVISTIVTVISKVFSRDDK